MALYLPLWQVQGVDKRFMVQNEVGALNGILDKIAQAGINVKLALATACGEQTLVVIDTDNNAEAAKVC